MKKTVKVTLVFGIIVTVCIIGMAVLLIARIDQATTKNTIVRVVQNKTGRQLTIDGKVQWLFFPWLGIKAYNVTLNNSVDFKDKEFAKVGEVSFSVKLLPLIFGRVEINHLVLRDFSLWLITNGVGVSNWQNLLVSSSGVTNQDKVTGENSNSTRFVINKIQISNGQAFWHNYKTDKLFKVSGLDLQCNNINFDKPFAVKTKFSFQDSDLIINSNVQADIQVQSDAVNNIVIKNMQLSGDLINQQMSQSLGFKSEILGRVDLDKQQLFIENFKLYTADVEVLGSLRASDIFNLPNLMGAMTINGGGNETLLQVFGINTGTLNLSKTIVKTNFEVTPKAIKLAAINANLDDINLRGEINYDYAKNVEFDVTLNKLDINTLVAGKKVVAPVLPVAVEQGKVLSVITEHGIVKSPAKKIPEKRDFSFDFLRVKNWIGNIKIDNLKYEQFDLHNFSAKIINNKGLINCQRFNFDFYHGNVNGIAIIDIRDAIAKLNFKLLLNQVALQPLLIDVSHYNKFSGNLTVNADISMYGETSKELINSLHGIGNVLVANGAYFGINVPYEVNRANAIINKQPMPIASQSQHTNFDRLTMGFSINNAVLYSNDFLILAPDYKVTGAGSANFAAQRLDLKLSAYSNNADNYFVPITVTGPFSNPVVKPDVAVIATQVMKKEIKAQITKQLQRLNVPRDIAKILPLDKLIH